ncbi:MAG: LPS export ABC transporter periplasmic protein LptC [Campylobacteraceae bacterium]
MIALLTQEPYSFDMSNQNGSIASIELLHVKDYNINEEGVVMAISADRALRFSDRDVLYTVDAYMNKNNTVETLKSNNATIKNEVIYLDGNVIYTRDKTLKLTTEEVEYYQKNGTIVGKTLFRIEDSINVAHGDGFVYNTKNGVIDAKNIKALIETENRTR